MTTSAIFFKIGLLLFIPFIYLFINIIDLNTFIFYFNANTIAFNNSVFFLQLNGACT